MFLSRTAFRPAPRTPPRLPSPTRLEQRQANTPIRVRGSQSASSRGLLRQPLHNQQTSTTGNGWQQQTPAAGNGWQQTVKPLAVPKVGAQNGVHTLFFNQYPGDEVGVADRIAPERLKKMTNKFNYVVTQEGELIIGRIRRGVGGGHIDLTGGKPVRAAGEVKVIQGKIKFLDNASGHYLPRGANAQKAAEGAFRAQGFEVEGRYIEKIRLEGRGWVPIDKA